VDSFFGPCSLLVGLLSWMHAHCHYALTSCPQWGNTDSKCQENTYVLISVPLYFLLRANNRGTLCCHQWYTDKVPNKVNDLINSSSFKENNSNITTNLLKGSKEIW